MDSALFQSYQELSLLQVRIAVYGTCFGADVLVSCANWYFFIVISESGSCVAWW